MTHLLRSWKESLSLFIPKNAKLFILVTLKTIIQSYKLIFAHLWWLFLVSWALDVINARYFYNIFFALLPLFAWLITIFCVYLVIRPSLQRKKFSYYWEKAYYFIHFFIITIFVFFVFFSIVKLLSMLAPLNEFQYLSIITLSLMPSPLMPLFISPPLTFMIFFALDSDGSLKSIFSSIIRGFKMALYNYPFCLIFYLICIAIALIGYVAILTFTFFGSSILLSSLVSHLLIPIPLSVLSNFYTKRLHDQFGLYYPDTVKE